MEIAIRPRLTRTDIEAIARERLGSELQFTSHEEFTDGFFNAAHALGLADGRHLVFKIAPDTEIEMMRYEVDLMSNEIEFFERVAADVPMPRLWHGDPKAGLMIMDRFGGANLQRVKDDIPETELLRLRRRIGALSARIGAVRGDRFGYPRKDGRNRSDDWGRTYTAIIDDVLADAVDHEVELPRPASEIKATLEAHRPLLEAVSVPALVHFDLWDGNIFVRETESGWEVEGFIDAERTFYGDALAELASLTAYISDQECAAVIEGFLGGRAPTEDEMRRVRLYRLYIWLILLVECIVRGYGSEETAEQQRYAGGRLLEELAALNA